jgi:hypothetical protein
LATTEAAWPGLAPFFWFCFTFVQLFSSRQASVGVQFVKVNIELFADHPLISLFHTTYTFLTLMSKTPTLLVRLQMFMKSLSVSTSGVANRLVLSIFRKI